MRPMLDTLRQQRRHRLGGRAVRGQLYAKAPACAARRVAIGGVRQRRPPRREPDQSRLDHRGRARRSAWRSRPESSRAVAARVRSGCHRSGGCEHDRRCVCAPRQPPLCRDMGVPSSQRAIGCDQRAVRIRPHPWRVDPPQKFCGTATGIWRATCQNACGACLPRNPRGRPQKRCADRTLADPGKVCLFR